MVSIKFVGKARGFLKQLLSYNNSKIKFDFDNTYFYETNSKLKIFIREIFKSKLGDYLGLIMSVKVNEKENRSLLSYNKFLNSNKSSYSIILENPTALYHYSLDRKSTYLGKKRLSKLLNNKNLKNIICISKACYNTLDKLTDDLIPERVKKVQIYPLIKRNLYVKNKDNINVDKIKTNCLFISSNFALKGGYEIIEAFKMLDCKNLCLTLITNKKEIKKETLDYIEKNDNIKIIDFNLEYSELEKIYSKNDILLHPTRQDSFALVILEAMKAGNCIIASNLYAIKEMVINYENGFLFDTKYKFFNEDDLPNKEVWNNRKKTIYSDYIDNDIVINLYEKILFLHNNHDILKKMKKKSFEIANEGEFSEQYIIEKYSEILSKVDK